MKSTNLLIALAMFVIAFTSCQQAPPPPPDLAKIRTEIQGMENAFAEAFNARDAAKVVSYYADDAVSLADNSPMLTGKEAILKNQQEQFASDTTNMTASFEVIDIHAAGDLVVETGKATFKDPSGAVIYNGKYISVFEKRDGKYLCIRDCYNSDKKD